MHSWLWWFLIIMLLLGRLYNLTLIQTLLWPVYPKQNIADVRLLLLQPFLILLVMVLSQLFLRIKEEKYREVAVLVTFLLYGLPYFNVNDKEQESVVKIGTLAYRNDWKWSWDIISIAILYLSFAMFRSSNEV